jgi:predicted CoA-substrate-specific enzyme activase
MKNHSEGKNTWIVAGVDIGAATAKAVILNGNKLLSFSILPTGPSVAGAGEMVIKETLRKAGLSMGELEYIISTGYGRRAVPFANKALTEIICHAAGVSSLMPQARTVIDIGGQDSKVIGLDDNGNVTNFAMNDKCAAGTGRFLEVMAGVLGVKIGEMGAVSLLGKDPCQISSTCTVFAETEMVSLRAEGESRENLLAGIHKAMARRVAIMGGPVGFKKEVVFTGGVAKNVGIKKALEDEIGLEILIPEEPQIMGALGAALLAEVELSKLCKVS